jgi:chromosome partitioning protein
MSGIRKTCSVCANDFEPQFRYQMEERMETGADGRTTVRFAFYCSQHCLDQSHGDGTDNTVTCDACAASFQIELASHVLFVGGRRRYACSLDCRAQLQAEARGLRLVDAIAEAAPEAPAAEPALPSGRAPVQSELARPSAALAASSPAARRPAPPELPPPDSTMRLGREPAPPRVVAVFNHKGGTGKTTTAVTVAAGLAHRGHRVLLVDTDSQGNVAVSLGVTSERSLYHVLVMGLDLDQAVTTARPNLDVLPANETLAAAELYLAGRKQRDRVLAARLGAARQRYDFVIVDCSPSLSLMNQNALVMADGVLCPVACDYLSLIGVRQVLRTLKQVNRVLGHPVELWGILPTLFDGRARICREALETLREHFGERCLMPVRVAIKVKEAPAEGKTLLEYAPSSAATSDYLRVVDRLLEVGRRPTVRENLRASGGEA